jgi:phosphate:Na+ symporter
MLCQDSIKKELWRMLEMARENVHGAFDVFRGVAVEKHAEITEREEYVDFLNKEISSYITSVVSHENTSTGGRTLNAFYTIASNIERIGDHAINIADYIGMITQKEIVFSEYAKGEVTTLQKICDELFAVLFDDKMDILKKHEKVATIEQRMDDVTVEFRNNMFERLRSGSCSDEGSILFSEMLTDFERIGDHALNISQELMKIEWNTH